MSFTYEYSQPEDYHFSLDSILTPKLVANFLKTRSDLQNFKVMDLCAGCGVMGFELSWHLPQIREIRFVEVQEVYQVHFEKNVKMINRNEVSFLWQLANYERLDQQELRSNFDLILCNPPYFRVDQGKLSPSEFKNRCRFFIDSSFQKLIERILWLMKPEAQAFLLIRDLSEHSKSVFQELEILVNGRASFEKFADVRGTDLIRIHSKI